jgi:uncharacterized protein YfaS (alpha-2-macroglobulin family)
MMATRRKKRATRWLSILVLLALLIGACAPEAPQKKPSPTPSPTAGPGVQTGAVEPTTVPTDLPPTSTPIPTITPMPLPPPQLVGRSPAPNEEQPLDAPVELTFDQPMDKDSVESAFSLSPDAEGSFLWGDDRTVSYAVDGGLERGVRYSVELAGTAKNLEGTHLETPIEFEFGTVGFLAVSQVMPLPGSDELDPDTLVTVIFDRPVVPLTSISRQGELPSPLTFVPPVRGTGEWLNTSIYLFRPEDGLAPATQYKARVAAGIEDLTGGTLAEDYVWEFSTISPAIVKVQPLDNWKYMGPTDVISVTFNQPMDHASAQERFALEAAGELLPGAFSWQGGETAIDPEVMAFVPEEPLARGTLLRARLAAGAQAKAGSMAIAQDQTWSLATVEEPAFVATSPKNGAVDVDPGGSLRLTFASPMKRQEFLPHLTISPQVTAVYTYWTEVDTKVRLYFDREPDSLYTVTLDADTPDRYGGKLGDRERLRFTTGDLSPYATLSTGGRLGTYSTYTETVVYATHRNVSRLDMSLYTLSPEAFMRLNSDWKSWDEFVPDEGDLVRRWSRKVKVQRNETALTTLDLVDDSGRPPSPGLYYLELTAPEVAGSRNYRPSRYMFAKSAVNLVLKQTHSEALVWATDLRSGASVADLPVELYTESGPLGDTGITDAQGLYRAEDLEVKDLWVPFYAITGKPGDDDFGIAYNGWDSGISPWDFSVDSEFWSSSYQGYMYTDRPIYRPGQTVYFKGIVRADDDARYSLPEDIETVGVRIDDPQGKELYNEKLPLNDMGTLFDELSLSEEAPLGTYYIEIQDPTHDFYAGTSFSVAEYKKPEFQVMVDAGPPSGSAWLSGDTVEVSAEATYYFGGPLDDANVRWAALSSPYSFRYQCPQGEDCPWYSWADYEWGRYDEREYYGAYGRLVSEAGAKTDDQGRTTFEVLADLQKETQSQVYTLEASVTDVNGQQVSNRAVAIVHKGAFYIGVAPRGYLAQAGEEKQVDLLVVDWDSLPVADVDLTVEFMEHRWYSVRERAEDGNFYWTWTTEDVPARIEKVTTGDDGSAVVAFTPKKAGSYRVRVTGRDAHANEIRSSAYFWVWGGSEVVSWRRESNNRIDLIADKDEYEVGDVAEILVPSPYTGPVQALVTVERGHVIETEVRELASSSEVLRVPIVSEHVPNVFVSVVIVEGSEGAVGGLATFKMGLVKLPVSLASKELQISLTPDKEMEAGEHYSPRQTATYDVLVTDDAGEPVETELSLRLADLAVLALADEREPTLIETFWRSRGLAVKTSMPLVVSMERYNREIAPEAKGGGGGEGEGLVRSEFADTAFWDPQVRTDKDGKAQVSVRMPDNLTTWRMQARGITADTLVGRAEVDILSTLELLVRPVLPRFLVVGDQVEMATIVHNNTAEALEAEVNISADGLDLESEAGQTVQVDAGGKVKVVWLAEVLPGDEVTVRMWASADDPRAGASRVLYDGREDTLPVYRFSAPEVVATAGNLPEPGTRQEIVQLPRAFDPTQGELTVQLDGSLTAATQDALDYLEHYPYECVEQTVSRFLPNVVTWQAMEEMGIKRPEVEQKLAQMVGVALQRLYNQQHYDGGWGWWVSDKSHAYLTAYVLQGMLEARRAGFVVDEDVMVKARDYVRGTLPSVSRVDTHWQANRLAYQLYVLAEHDHLIGGTPGGELGLAVRLFEKRHLLSRYGRATLAVALGLLEPDEPERVQTLLSDLGGDAVVSATGAHWQEDKADYWNMNTDIRTTAIVVWALSRSEPDNVLLPSAVRWLMAVRKEGHWESTQTTSWSLVGLVAYMRSTGELQGDFDYQVYLNGQEWASGTVSKEDIDEGQTLQIEVGRLLVDESNRLVIERLEPAAGQTGAGQLYYTAQLRYYLPAESVQALDRGVMVARQYSPVDQPGTYVDTAQVGDVIKVKLTLVAPTDLHYVVVEDPLPAGFEGVDLSLKTTSVVGEAPSLRKQSPEEESRWVGWQGWGWWWFSHSEMRDEKVALFATYLPRGTYEYTYLMRASVPGEYRVMPTAAYEMYFPEVFGRSDGGRFNVQPAN